jgi:hypothetical protein
LNFAKKSMKYSKDSLTDRLILIIAKSLRHKNYDKTIKVADFWRKIMTGDDQDEILISYKLSETKEQKQQRIRLYNSRTSYASHKIISTFKEVERSEEISNSITLKKNDETPDELMTRLKTYESGFRDYVHESVRRLNFFDPNAWIINEFYQKNESEKPFCYPLEILSPYAIDYEYYYGDLQYLAIKQNVKVMEPIEKSSTSPLKNVTKEYAEKDGSQYTIYGPEWSIRMTEYYGAPSDLEIITIEKKEYTVEYFNYKYKTVPAIQVGYIKDPSTNWETFESPLYSARHIFNDLINTKAEYDLAKAIHGFIQKFAYAESCDYSIASEDGNDRCDNGTMILSRGKCPSCKGTGKKVHTTVQDVILVKLPSDKSEHIPLSEYIYYQEIPKHIIDGYKQDIKDLEIDISLAIFNKDTFSQSEVSTTATEIRLNKQSVYNVLYEFALNVQKVYKELALQVADVINLRDDINVEYTLPRDFQMESIDDLLLQRRNAIGASVPYDIVAAIDRKILMKQNMDNSDLVSQIKAQDLWRPFKDKTESERIGIISMLADDDPDKVLYIYFDKIFTEIWNDVRYNNFHKLTYKIQKNIVDDAVKNMIKLKTPPEPIMKQGLIEKTDPETQNAAE